MGDQHGGRLAAWNGTGNWIILEQTAFVEVTGRYNFGQVVYATGWDRRSVILKVLDNGDSADPTLDGAWQTYRLPKSSHTWGASSSRSSSVACPASAFHADHVLVLFWFADHLWTTEWPRIKEIISERCASLVTCSCLDSTTHDDDGDDVVIGQTSWICTGRSLSSHHWAGTEPRGACGPSRRTFE